MPGCGRAPTQGDTLRSISTSRRAIAAAGLTAVLLAGGATASHAAPAPDRGIDGGGTRVTLPAPEVRFTQVDGGSSHSLGLGDDGDVYAWGSGELGTGPNTIEPLPAPVQAPAGLKFTQVSAGQFYSLALSDDGNAYAWGLNSQGQLGDGTRISSNVPVPVRLPAGVTLTQVSAGYTHSLAVSSDGDVYAWGGNSYGRLGDGTTNDSDTPVRVPAPAGARFVQVSASNVHSLALASDGTAYAWGFNHFGVLGDGTNTDAHTPVEVQAPSGVRFTEVASGYVHSMALGDDGLAYAWGSNGLGQLGDGTNISANAPGQVALPTGVRATSIASSQTTGAAVGDDGELYIWGMGTFGQLGDGTNDLTNAPTRVQQPAGVRLSRLGALDHHYLALGDDGHAYAWGSGALGTLGSGSHGSGASSNTPVPVRIESAVTSVDFGGTSGSDLVDNADGTVSVTAPPHASGPVDVEVRWTLNGKPRAPIAYASGFTYLSMPSLGDPSDQRVAAGATATFTVTVTGEPAPTVTWEVSDGGAQWRPIAADPAAAASTDGLTLSVVAGAENDGHRYRAIAANEVGDTTSRAARLTVIPDDGKGDADGGNGNPGGAGDSDGGSGNAGGGPGDPDGGNGTPDGGNGTPDGSGGGADGGAGSSDGGAGDPDGGNGTPDGDAGDADGGDGASDSASSGGGAGAARDNAGLEATGSGNGATVALGAGALVLLGGLILAARLVGRRSRSE